MNLENFQEIIKEEILAVYNLDKKITYIFDDFFWIAQTPNKNNLFVAIKGGKTDGNLFLETAITFGYKYILSDNLEKSRELAIKFPAIIFLVVMNIQKTLNTLATWGISKFKGIKFAITGSSGKTTTTYILNNLLKHYGTVVSTHKYNTQYYLKRLCFNLYSSTADFFVAELSSDAPGTIWNLSRIIKPHYSIIVSMGYAHSGPFGGEENILKEKTSIVENTQIETFIPVEYKEKIKNLVDQKKIRYVKEDFYPQQTHVHFIFPSPLMSIIVKNPSLKGYHNYSNMNLVLRALNKIKNFTNKKKLLVEKTLGALTCFPGRGNILFIKSPNYDFKITCEDHNSNPLSFMRALHNIEEPTLVILGYFYELGTITEEAHKKALELLEENPYISGIILGDEKLYTLPFLVDFKKILPLHKDISEIFRFIKDQKITNIFVKGGGASNLKKYIEEILNKVI